MTKQEAFKRTSRFTIIAPGTIYTFTEKDIEAINIVYKQAKKSLKTQKSILDALDNYKEKLKARKINTDKIIDIIKVVKSIFKD